MQGVYSVVWQIQNSASKETNDINGRLSNAILRAKGNLLTVNDK